MTAGVSLRRRLVLASAAWLSVALALGALVLDHAFTRAVEHAFHERLDAHLRALAAVVDRNADGTLQVGAMMGEPRFEQPYSGWYWQISDGAGQDARSRSLWDFVLPLTGAPSGVLHRSIAQGPDGQKLEVAERDITTEDNGALLHLAVAADRAELEAERASFRLLLASASTILALGLVAAVALQVGYGLKPLTHLAGELSRVRTEGGRIQGSWPAEVAPLAEAVNRVLDHDAALITRARGHMGNLAHAMKTPLAVLAAELEAKPGDPSVMRAQAARLGQLVDLHLGRARAEAVAAPDLGSSGTLVRDVVDGLAQALMRIHAARGIQILVALDPASRFAGSADDLSELLGNLLDNACKWAVRCVRVRAESGVLVVADDGPGMTEPEVEAALGRGVRLDERPPGAGLGLAIVADLTSLLGLSLEFGRSSELGGLEVRLGLVPVNLAGATGAP